jgi:hypothetical protein
VFFSGSRLLNRKQIIAHRLLYRRAE